MKKTVTLKKRILEKRETFRHLDLRNALLAAGIEMARIGDPIQSFCEKQPGRRAFLLMRHTGTLPTRLNYWMRCDRHVFPSSPRPLKMK